MLTKEDIIKRLEKHKGIIRAFGIKKIELFGSYAKNEQRKNSDLDFLVYFQKKRGGYQDRLDILHFLQKLFIRKKVDVVKGDLIKEELKESILKGERIGAKI